MNAGFVLLALMPLVVIGCTDGVKSISDNGRVVYMSFEGGFYGIVTEKGDHFLPENLSADFQKDSLQVSFEGFITDRPTTQMWGRTITLTRINRINN